MNEGSEDLYHRRRAARQRAIGETSETPEIAAIHHRLAELHEARIERVADRPKLGIVVPA